METMSAQQKDAAYAQIAAELAEDGGAPAELRALADDPRVTVRRGGVPARGKCVVYWMQRAQRGRDNHALDKAVDVANALGLPCVAYFAGIKQLSAR
jgi:deoxyribodipyrimidine photo-lyase